MFRYDVITTLKYVIYTYYMNICVNVNDKKQKKKNKVDIHE